MESLENLENQYDDFLTCRQAVQICKISVKSPPHGSFESLISNTL